MSVESIVRWHGDIRDTVVTLPLKTVSESNMREHWGARSKRAKEQRGASKWACGAPLAAYRTGLAKQYVDGVTVRLVRIAPRKLDDDNLRGALKAVRDGVTDALGLASDRDERVAWTYEQESGAVAVYAVRVTVTNGRAVP